MMNTLHNLWRKLDSPRATLLVVLGLYLLFFGVQMIRFDGDISHFVSAGDYFADAAGAPVNLTILVNSDGYDGQFYYRLAIDPFTRERTAHGISIDTPAYRQQRILYPLLAHLVSLGQIALVPLAMVVVNLVAVAFIAWFCGSLAQHSGCHALLGLGLALYPGLLLSFDRDLTELTEIMLLVAALLALARQRHGLATLAICLALLAKETALGLAIAALPAFLWARLAGREDDAPRWHFWLAPGALYVAWQIWLRHRWGVAALTTDTIRVNVSGTSGGLRLPALVQVFWQSLVPFTLTAVELLLLMLFGLVVLVALWRSQASPHVKLAFVAYAGLALIIKHYWGGDWAFLRALSEYWVIGGLVLLAWDRRAAWALGTVTAAFWGLALLRVIGLL